MEFTLLKRHGVMSLVVLSCILLSSCEKQEKTLPQTQLQQTSLPEFYANVRPFVTDGSSDFKLEHIESSEDVMNLTVDQTVMALIRKSVDTSIITKTDTLGSLVEKLVAYKTQHPHIRYNLQINTKILHSPAHVIAFEVIAYHRNLVSYQYLNFDSNTKKLLLPQDILLPNQMARVAKMIHQQKVPQNYHLNAKGLVFHTPVKVVIPYAKLKGILRSEYSDVI